MRAVLGAWVATAALLSTPVVAADLKTRAAAAAAYSEANDGQSTLVLQNGDLIFEHYANGGGPGTPAALWSGTKAFHCGMAAAAVEDGLMTLDEPVSKTISEWRSDPARAAITLRQLMSLTSGLEPGGVGKPRTYAQSLEVPVKFPPGARFAYGPNPWQILGEVMRRKLAPRGETVRGYVERRVLEPIGAKLAEWEELEGEITMNSGAHATAREWAKYGELLRLDGAWKGRRVLPAEPLRACRQGSAANPAYGLTMWLNTPQRPGVSSATYGLPAGRILESGAPDLFAAVGYGKQRLYVIPSLKLVVVRQGGQSPSFRDDVFLGALLGLPPNAPQPSGAGHAH